MYEAMQRGQVDCALGSANYLNTYNIKDFVTSIVDEPIGAYVSTLTLSINLDAWEGMSTENRQIIIDEIPQLLADIKWAAFEDDAAGPCCFETTAVSVQSTLCSALVRASL